MILILILTAIKGLVLALLAIASVWHSFRRKRLLILPFPAAWESRLQRNGISLGTTLRLIRQGYA